MTRETAMREAFEKAKAQHPTWIDARGYEWFCEGIKAALSTLPTMTEFCELRELCTAIVARAFPAVLPIGHYAVEEVGIIELKQMLERIARFPQIVRPS